MNQGGDISRQRPALAPRRATREGFDGLVRQDRQRGLLRFYGEMDRRERDLDKPVALGKLLPSVLAGVESQFTSPGRKLGSTRDKRPPAVC